MSELRASIAAVAQALEDEAAVIEGIGALESVLKRMVNDARRLGEQGWPPHQVAMAMSDHLQSSTVARDSMAVMVAVAVVRIARTEGP